MLHKETNLVQTENGNLRQQLSYRRLGSYSARLSPWSVGRVICDGRTDDITTFISCLEDLVISFFPKKVQYLVGVEQWRIHPCGDPGHVSERGKVRPDGLVTRPVPGGCLESTMRLQSFFMSGCHVEVF